jgi:hypothetical protein
MVVSTMHSNDANSSNSWVILARWMLSLLVKDATRIVRDAMMAMVAIRAREEIIVLEVIFKKRKDRRLVYE